MAKIHDALKISINFERKGMGFYLTAAAEAKNTLTRRLFYALNKK